MTREDFEQRIKPGVHIMGPGINGPEEMIVRSVSGRTAHVYTKRQPSGSYTLSYYEIPYIIGDEMPALQFGVGDLVSEIESPDNIHKIISIEQDRYITERLAYRNQNGYIFLPEQWHFTKVFENPAYGIDCDDCKYISEKEVLERYLWKNPHGEIATLYDKFEKRYVDMMFSLGYVYFGLGVHYNVTKRGRKMFNLRYKPRTLWERLQDWFYFKILRVKIEL